MSQAASAERELRDLRWQDADRAVLRANLSLTPAQRIAELVAMNRLHAEMQERTLTPALRAALEEREREEADAQWSPGISRERSAD